MTHFKCISVLFVLFFVSIVLPLQAQTSFSLTKALQMARTQNLILKTEAYYQGMAQADIITAKLRPNPILNNQTLQLAKPSLFPPNTEWHSGQNRQIWWQLTKPFQPVSLRRNKILFAEQNLSLTQKNYAETERNLFLSVALKWLDVWVAQKQLNIVQTAKSNIDSLLRINKLRYDKQVITQSDLLRTQILADQYDVQIISTEQNYINELNNLQLLLSVQGSISIDTTSTFIGNLPTNIDSLLLQALSQRTDLQRIRSTIEVANTNVKLQKSLALPQPELGVIYNPQNTVPYVGVYGTLKIPVFDRNQGEIKKSEVAKLQAEESLQATQLQAQTEVQVAYRTYVTEQKNVEKFKTIINQSEQILQSVRYAYTKGGTTIVDFLEAQRSWLDTQQQYNDTVYRYRQAYIQLLFATGLINQLAQ